MLLVIFFHFGNFLPHPEKGHISLKKVYNKNRIGEACNAVILKDLSI